MPARGDWLGMVFLLILAYLLIVNYKGSEGVIGALGTAGTNAVAVLQGRSLQASTSNVNLNFT